MKSCSVSVHNAKRIAQLWKRCLMSFVLQTFSAIKCVFVLIQAQETLGFQTHRRRDEEPHLNFIPNSVLKVFFEAQQLFKDCFSLGKHTITPLIHSEDIDVATQSNKQTKCQKPHLNLDWSTNSTNEGTKRRCRDAGGDGQLMANGGADWLRRQEEEGRANKANEGQVCS